MRAGRAVLVALLSAALALGGCAQPGDGTDVPEAEDDLGRTARGGGDGDDDDDGADPVVVTIGGTSGGVLGPGTYPLTVAVPAGGVTDVEWSLAVTPTTVFTLDRVDGPGCTGSGWYSSVTSAGTSGSCDDLPEGQHDFTFVLNAAVATHSVRVQGTLLEPPEEAEPAPGNTTGDARDTARPAPTSATET